MIIWNDFESQIKDVIENIIETHEFERTQTWMDQGDSRSLGILYTHQHLEPEQAHIIVDISENTEGIRNTAGEFTIVTYYWLRIWAETLPEKLNLSHLRQVNEIPEPHEIWEMIYEDGWVIQNTIDLNKSFSEVKIFLESDLKQWLREPTVMNLKSARRAS